MPWGHSWRLWDCMEVRGMVEGAHQSLKCNRMAGKTILDTPFLHHFTKPDLTFSKLRQDTCYDAGFKELSWLNENDLLKVSFFLSCLQCSSLKKFPRPFHHGDASGILKEVTRKGGLEERVRAIFGKRAGHYGGMRKERGGEDLGWNSTLL